MKKLLVCLCLLCLFGCSYNKTEKNEIEIGKVTFDNQVITFYDEQVSFNEGAITTSWLYYKTDSINLKNDGSLTSKDGSMKMYVDFYGTKIVTNEMDVVIEPVESLKYKDHDLNVYILDTNSKYYKIDKGKDDYSFLRWTTITGESSTSSNQIDVDIEQLKLEVDGWMKIDDYKEYASYDDFELYFEVQLNKEEIDNYINIWQFFRAQLDDGRWTVRIDDNDNRQYYLLNKEQVDNFKKLLNIQ